MRFRTAMLVVLFVLSIWAGAAGISYAVVEIAGGGPQGEQGPQGPPGPAGPPGTSTTTTSGSSTDCGRAVDALIEAFSTPGLSDTQLGGLTLAAQFACQ